MEGIVNTITELDTLDAGNESGATWTADEQRFIYNSSQDGEIHLYWRAADGTGPAERLTEDAHAQSFGDLAVTPDGTRVVGRILVDDRQNDLIAVTLDEDHAIETLLIAEFNEQTPTLSPNGKWLAYFSPESGQAEVYVRPFPGLEAVSWKISTAGGRDPVWSRNGEELFFATSDRLMSAPVQTDESFTHGTPEALFETGNYLFGPGSSRDYDVARDGRFLMLKVEGQAAPRQITVVLNWFEELKTLVPAGRCRVSISLWSWVIWVCLVRWPW